MYSGWTCPGRSGSTDVWIYATGDLDTDGWLYDHSGNLIVANGAGFIGNQRHKLSSQVGTGQRGLLRRRRVATPTALPAKGQPGTTGCTPRLRLTPGSTRGTATRLNVNSLAPGRIDTARDADYFRMDLPKHTNLVIHAVNLFLVYEVDERGRSPSPHPAPLAVEVLDADGRGGLRQCVPDPSSDIFGDLQPAIWFYIRDDFGPGAYYFKVTTPAGVTSHPVPYTIHAYEDTAYTRAHRRLRGGGRARSTTRRSAIPCIHASGT